MSITPILSFLYYSPKIFVETNAKYGGIGEVFIQNGRPFHTLLRYKQPSMAINY